MNSVFRTLSTLGLWALASSGAAQPSGPGEAAGAPMAGDPFQLEGSRWQGPVGTETLLSEVAEGVIRLRVTPQNDPFAAYYEYEFAPLVLENGHLADGTLTMMPGPGLIEEFGCPAERIPIGTLEACFADNLNEIRGKTRIHTVLEGPDCTPRQVGGTAEGIAAGSPISVYRVGKAEVPEQYRPDVFARSDMNEVLAVVEGRLGSDIDRMGEMGNRELQNLVVTLRRARDRLAMLPMPPAQADRARLESAKAWLSDALDSLEAMPPDVWRANAPSSTMTPFVCLRDAPRPCRLSDRDRRFVPAAQTYLQAIRRAELRHEGIPETPEFQPADTGQAKSEGWKVLRQSITNRGPVDNLARLRPEYRRLSADLQRFILKDWCDTERFVALEDLARRLDAEFSWEHRYLRMVAKETGEALAYNEAIMRRALDTWSEWSVMEELTGYDVDVLIVAPFELLNLSYDILGVLSGEGVTSDFEDWFFSVADLGVEAGLYEWGAGAQAAGAATTASRLAKGAGIIGGLKAVTDVVFATSDIVNLAALGERFGESDPDEVIPLVLRYTEQAAYVEHSLRHANEIAGALARITELIAEERSRRF